MNINYKPTYQELAQEYKEELRAFNRKLGIEETLEYIKDYGHLFVLEGEEVTQSPPHLAAIRYLVPLLQWLFHNQQVGIAEDILFYLPGVEDSKITPDIAILDGLVITTSEKRRSYGVGQDVPPPRVVFEIASESTWENDVTDKLRRYRLLQAHEYFTFDPNPEQVWQGEWLERGRLIGWQLQATGIYKELELDSRGRLWSNELDRWLKAEVEPETDSVGQRIKLQLYYRNGQLQKNETQVEQQLRLQAQFRAEQIEAELAGVALAGLPWLQFVMLKFSKVCRLRPSPISQHTQS